MTKRTIWVACCVVAVMTTAGTAAAQTGTDSEKNIRVVQQKSFMMYHRVELVPTFTLALNENLTRHIGAGAQARFHITDEWAVGIDYIKYFGKNTALATEVGDQFQVYPKKLIMNFFVGAHTTYVPLYGKFLFFGLGPINWDLHLSAGLGATRINASDYKVTGNIGFGFRFRIWKFLSFNAEIRDYMFMGTYSRDDQFVNNVVFTTGLGFFVPFNYDYVYPK
ncbi:MAG: outer membrane beta-barrel domain-containing protein [Deltaproteobacteria bacterium]|nr:outer membrane beta-barrel domain-containing protein [Deltaproteobacteria bacterium]